MEAQFGPEKEKRRHGGVTLSDLYFIMPRTCDMPTDMLASQDELMMKDECILVNYMDEVGIFFCLADANSLSGKIEQDCHARSLVTTTNTTVTSLPLASHEDCCREPRFPRCMLTQQPAWTNLF